MNKILIIALISLYVVFADCQQGGGNNNSTSTDCLCHPSCNCQPGSSICTSCRLESLGAVLDQNKKSCPCPTGYFTSSLTPFNCTQLFVPDQSESDNGEDACHRDIEMRIKDISLSNNCYFCNLNGTSYVVSEVSLNLNSVSLSDDCKSLLDQKIKVLHPDTNSFEDLDQKYLEQRSNGGWVIRIPLIDVFNFSMTTNVGSQQIAQQIQLLSLLGTQGQYVKQIKWTICVYTNRDVVQVFQLDVDIQETEQDCIDCIVIADLETVAVVYSDDTFSVNMTAPFQYYVGDTFYAKITFKDSTYTKFLRFVALYYKNDLGQIFDYSSVTVHSWQDNGLTIALPLSEPSHPAYIQVQMLIDDKQGGRFLQDTTTASTSSNSDQNQPKTTFQVGVSSNQQDAASNDSTSNNQSSNNSMLMFGLVNLMALIYLI